MIRSRTGVILFISGILFTLILTVCTFLVLSRTIYKNQRFTFFSIQQKTSEEKQEKKVLVKVLAAAQKIEKNEEITDLKTKLIEIQSDTVPPNAVLNADVLKGKKAAVALELNTIITESMLYSIFQELKETDRLLDYELPGGLVGGLVDEGSYIDIEFVKTKGETFVVLSKKLVKKKLDNDRIILLLTFEERRLINYALAEQKILGGRLEAAIYADERQPLSKVNYPIPKLDINQQQVTQVNKSEPEKQSQPIPSDADRPLMGGN
ncbi:MAG: hypothetical protein FIA99_04365 [Ruminiclostridium sp.]|nr:hypothetical protein [Ruminiclostridium sp.]